MSTAMDAKAGYGDPRRYLLEQPKTVTGTTDPSSAPIGDTDYLSVYAVTWFINRESTWFTDWSASGAVSITMDGTSRYDVGLGVFELDHGARTAPVFDKAILPQRAFRGGNVEIDVSLTGFKKATTLLKLLKSASSASLGIVAGMVQTAASTGPLSVLSAAGSDLIGGVQGILSETGENREPFFPAGALNFTLTPDQLTAKQSFVLLHRGSPLSTSQLKVAEHNGQTAVINAGLSLEDGVWMLLRFDKSKRYDGVRPWHDSQVALEHSMANLREDVRQEVMTTAAALKQLGRGTESKRTLFDRFIELRSSIQSDPTITERDATVRVAAIADLIASLRDELRSGKPPAKHAPLPEATLPTKPADVQRRALTRHATSVAKARADGIREMDTSWIKHTDALNALEFETTMLRRNP